MREPPRCGMSLDFRIFLLSSRKFLRHIRYLHLEQKNIVILAAVRTPCGQPLGQLSSINSPHLTSVVLEAAVKQSSVPLENVKHIYLAEKAQERSHETNIGELLKKAKIVSVKDEGNVGIHSLLLGIEALQTNISEFVVVAGVDSASERMQRPDKLLREKNSSNASSQATDGAMDDGYINVCKKLHQKAAQKGLLDAELVTLKALQISDKRRVQVEIVQDELSEQNTQESDGAAALVLTTINKIPHYNLKPLAAIKGIACTETPSSLLNALKDLIDPCLVENWEIDNKLILDSVQKNFKISSDNINPCGSSMVLGQNPITSMYRMLTHMCHTMKTNKLGCLININLDQSLAILLEKLPTVTSFGTLPRLTLFTKDPCNLCDMLLEELELNFPGEYDLEKIYIDTKENVRYLRLYRHDIPVLYLNGQYLCMHRLNVRLLRQKMELLKQQQL